MSKKSGSLDGLQEFKPKSKTETPTEWYATELHGGELDYAMETIGPITEAMRVTLYDLYNFYTTNGFKCFCVFEYDFLSEEIVSYLILPEEIFENMWDWKTVQFDMWNDVVRKPLTDADRPPSHIRETAAVAEEGKANEWAEGP